jgi:hypothetical protein
MHQGALSLVAVVAFAGIMSAVFCAALLMKRKRAQTMLRKAAEQNINNENTY